MEPAYFEKHILPLKHTLFRTALWLLKSREDAEDVVQDVLLKIWTGSPDEPSNPEAYCSRAVRNACIDRLRKKKVHITEIGTVEEGHHDKDTPLHRVLTKEGDQLIEKIILQLPEDHRLLLQLRNVEGFSMKQIAAIMNTNENALSVMLSRVRKKIHQEYLRYAQYGTK